MPDEIPEAKDFDSIADKLLNEAGKETPAGSSSETKPEDGTDTSKTTTAEVDKTEKVKEVEADASLSVEEKLAKIKEVLGDDEKALDAYIKQKGYHNDPAWQKQREIIERLKKEGQASGLSEEDRVALDEFKKYRSSPDYIRESMKSQGYTQEAIDKKLKESGVDIESKPQDDVNLVANKLGLKPEELNDSVRANIEDVAKIADIIFQDRMGKVLPKELGPVQNHLQEIAKSDNASKLVNTIKETVKTEGILNFDKDIEPALNKFLDENPDAVQQDVLEYFKSINHTMTVERLKSGKRQEERDDKRTNLRQNIPLGGTPKGVPAKTGSFEKDADAFLDSIAI